MAGQPSSCKDDRCWISHRLSTGRSAHSYRSPRRTQLISLTEASSSNRREQHPEQLPCQKPFLCLNRPAPLLTEEAASDTEGAKLFSLSTCTKKKPTSRIPTPAAAWLRSTGKLGAARCSSASRFLQAQANPNLCQNHCKKLQQMKEYPKRQREEHILPGKTHSDFSPYQVGSEASPAFVHGLVQDAPILQGRVAQGMSYLGGGVDGSSPTPLEGMPDLKTPPPSGTNEYKGHPCLLKQASAPSESRSTQGADRLILFPCFTVTKVDFE